MTGRRLRPGVYEVPFGVPLRHLVFDRGRAAPGPQHPSS